MMTRKELERQTALDSQVVLSASFCPIRRYMGLEHRSF